MSELGKSAKHMGHLHPSVTRRIDPDPARPTPRAKPKHKHEKNFGYEYEWVGVLGGPYKQRAVWFKTQGQRDQAMADFRKKWAPREWLRLIGPINRGSAVTPDGAS